MDCRRPILLAAAAFAALIVAPAALHAKCLAPTQTTAIPMLDGAVYSGSFENLDPQQVGAVYIMCWNPADSVLTSGGRGYGVAYLLSTARVERVEAAVAALIEAQREVYEETGRYAVRAAELDLDDDDELEGLRVQLGIDLEGWTATVSLADLPYACRVRGNTEGAGEPECDLDATREIKIAMDPAVLARATAGSGGR